MGEQLQGVVYAALFVAFLASLGWALVKKLRKK